MKPEIGRKVRGTPNENRERGFHAKTNPVLLVLVSVILVAGILSAGCTEQSGTGISPSGTPSPQGDRIQESNRTISGQHPAIPGNATGDGRWAGPGSGNMTPGQNMTAGPGPAMNGTRPSGPPGEGIARGGFAMNGSQPGEPPSGIPPEGGIPVNGTRPMPPSGGAGVPPGQ